jgi:sulfur carrier protein ThiS adenylyltransferase
MGMTFQEIRKKLKKKRVGIAGAGGLGSNCAIALARVGVGNLVIADFDKITRKNLNRQYYYMEQVGQHKVFALADNIFFVNPYIKVEPHKVRLNPKRIRSIFPGCDVIVEAFDLASEKEMLIETVQTAWPEVPLVIGLGMAGWGDSNAIGLRQVDNLYICGDGTTEIADELPPIAPRVGMVANMQANVVVDLLLNS